MNIMQDVFGTPINMMVSYYDSLWNKQFKSATHRFNVARNLAASDWGECAKITASEFFPYYKEWKANNPTRYVNSSSVDDGDFDDMGRGGYAGAYHYEQKRKRGRL